MSEELLQGWGVEQGDTGPEGGMTSLGGKGNVWFGLGGARLGVERGWDMDSVCSKMGKGAKAAAGQFLGGHRCAEESGACDLCPSLVWSL